MCLIVAIEKTWRLVAKFRPPHVILDRGYRPAANRTRAKRPAGCAGGARAQPATSPKRFVASATGEWPCRNNWKSSGN